MAEAIAAQRLLQMEPLNELGADYVGCIAEKAECQTLESGAILRANEERHWMVYLLEGRMRLVINGREAVVTDSAPRAVRPLFTVNRQHDHAVAQTPCVVVRIERQLFESLHKNQLASSYEITDTPLSEKESGIISDLFNVCMGGELAIPSMPDMAVRLQQALSREDINANALARLVQTDIAVTGGLLRAANSAMYGGMQSVYSVRDAIVRIGLHATRNLVTAIAMRQLFTAGSPVVRESMQALWRHSMEISALSCVIARRSPAAGIDPEEALLAGLLHDVGTVPILDYLGRNNITITEEELAETIRKLKPFVSEIVINNWGLGESLATVLKESEQWFRDHRPEPDCCDVVVVAQVYSMARAGGGEDVPHLDELPAYEKLQLVKVEAGQVDILEAAQDEIDAVIALLGG